MGIPALGLALGPFLHVGHLVNDGSALQPPLLPFYEYCYMDFSAFFVTNGLEWKSDIFFFPDSSAGL